MKKNLLFLLLLSFLKISFSQEHLPCGSAELMKNFYKSHPEIKAKIEARDAAHYQKDKEAYKNKSAFKTESSVNYTIPVVFHILHLDGNENISDNQVKDAMNILNRDFAKQNADTVDIIPELKSLADSTGIHFALATKNPFGQTTTGIIHYYDQNTDWSLDDPDNDPYIYTWDPTMYMNIYVVRTISLPDGFQAAGYTFFPGTLELSSPYDAIVVLNNYLGSIGTSNEFVSRVLTHEVGHWLGLHHVFGAINSVGVDCTGDDFISDTPETIGYYGCPDMTDETSYQICTPGISENFQNYMDYSYCSNMFTQGQAMRMQDELTSSLVGRENLSTISNLTATGIINPSGPGVPIADFKCDRYTTCTGTPVTFTDMSWNSDPNSYNWSFPGGTPPTSTDSMPKVVYNSPGVYSVTLISSSSAGSSAPVTKTNIIHVKNLEATYKNNWIDDFENYLVTDTNWTFYSSSGAVNWEISTDGAYSGNHSIKVDYLNNGRNTKTSMVSPAIDLTSFDNPVLFFQLATQQKTAEHTDKLQVLYSTDCGETWQEIYNKSGADLATAGISSEPFYPETSEDWRKDSILLSDFQFNSYVTFAFTYTRDTLSGTNNIYLDDIAVKSKGILGVEKYITSVSNILLFPNPSNGYVSISFDLIEKQQTHIYITDVLGQVVSVITKADLPAGKHKYETELKLSAGIYLLHVNTGQNHTTKKMVVK